MLPSPRLLLVCALFVASSPGLRAACNSPVLTQLPDVPVGSNPMNVAMADFDGDGRLDIATRDTTGAGVYVQKGNGNGTFQTGVVYPVGAENPLPLRVIAADLNNDNRPDLATANYFANTISVLLNNNGTGFATAMEFATVNGPSRLTAGHADTDGFLDLAVAGISSARVHASAGNGQYVGHYALTADGFPQDVAFGSFDSVNNGLDVAVYVRRQSQANPSYVRIHFRSALGTYTTQDVALAGNSPGVLTTRELNGDAYTDVIASNGSLETVSIIRGGTLTRVDYPTGEQPEKIETGDMNEDGKLDLVVATTNSMNFSILLGAGDGTFGTAIEVPVTAPQSLLSLLGVALGDLDGDGRPDVLFTDSGSSRAYVFDNNCAPRSAGISLLSSPNPSTEGQPVTLTATITVAGNIDPTGTVSFYEGTTLLGTVTVSNRSASLVIGAPSIGSHTYTANYSGDAEFGPSSGTTTHTVNLPPFGPPPNFAATGAPGGTSVSMTWTPTQNAVYYEILRLTNGNWETRGTSQSAGFTDNGAGSNASAFYAVRGVSSGSGVSGMSVDAASTVAFARPSIVAGLVIQAGDVTELRSVVAALRTAANSGPFPFTDSDLQGVPVKALHVNELRTALSQAMTGAGMQAPSFARSLTQGLLILAGDVEEIRTKVR